MTMAFILIGNSPTQTSRAKPYKGPRALGLLLLTAGGKARLTPIAILIDGKFYDASEYKASPVPMALWAETVYEGERTGVSEGVFTITAALQNESTKEWLGEGTWQPAGSAPAKVTKKQSSPVPRGLNDDEGPPVLRHGGSAPPKPPESTATPSPTGSTSTQSSSPPAAAPSTPGSTSASSSGNPPASSESSGASTNTTSDQEAENDKDRPTLKRGTQPPKPQGSGTTAKTVPPATTPAAHAATPTAPAKPSQIQLIPAISDADGPDSHDYAYILKPEETEQFRKKMLSLAAEEVRARAKQLGSEAVGVQASRPTTGKTASRQPQPNFEDSQLRVFDLSSSNEPVLILTARARMPRSGEKDGATLERQYIITLVARQDINGDLHKVLANVTDDQHLDVLPQLELIDAVDADGDGRGELLFRKVSDTSSAFVIYRVIGDQLYPLFEGSL